MNLCPKVTLVSIPVIAAILCVFPALSVAQSGAPIWKMQQSGTTASLRGVYSVDGKIAWASGTGGTVIKTIDSGEHWIRCATPDVATDGGTLDFRGVQALDSKIAIVMASGPGAMSRLYQTEDGCQSWKLIFRNPNSPEGFFDSFFADWAMGAGTPGWSGSLLGDPVHGRFMVFDSQDSGTTWTARNSADLALNGTDASAFAASNSLFPATQDNSHVAQIFASGGKGGALLWVEKIPDHTWRRITLPLAHGNDSSGIFSVAIHTESVPFRNVLALQETTIVVGGDYMKSNEPVGVAAWSTDRIHWTAATKPPHGYRSSVAWSPESQMWIAVGTNGSDMSRDDGKTWTPLDDGNWNALSLPFVVGPNGRIAQLSPSPAK